MSMFGGIFGGTSSSSKRNSTPAFKPAPLTPKLTTAVSPVTVEYPPHLSHDGQWEHVIQGSPSSPEVEDEAYERLGYSQVDGGIGDHQHQRSGGSGTVSPPSRGTGGPLSRWQEEKEELFQQVEGALAAQRKAENDRDVWERKVLELRSSIRSERDRERASTKSRRERERERDVGVELDAFREENEKLKIMLQKQTQQLDAAQLDMKRERERLQADVERLKGELDGARVSHKEEAEKMKINLQEHGQRIERLAADCDRIRRDKESVRANLSAEIDRMKVTHAKVADTSQKALEDANRERAQQHLDLRKAKKSLDAYVTQLDDKIRENNSLRHELAGAKESQRMVVELRQHLDIQNMELRCAREESSALKKEFHQLTALLEDRTSELKGAQSFLTTADAFSGTEVTSTLQRLNAEVLQSTAFMAETMVEQFFVETTTPQTAKSSEQLVACKRASAALGDVIVQFLGTKKHRDDPILIQIAFQAYLAYHLRWIACSWVIGGDENYNKFFDAIYQSVHDKEAQAIAGRWRALTRAHVPKTPYDDTKIAFQIATKIVSGLSDILLTAGCTAPKASIVSALSSKFSEKLGFLVSMAMRVNRIVGEDVTSGDFEVMATPPRTAFDATTMECSYDDGTSLMGDNMPKVLCATDLGLRKKTRVGTTGEKQWEIKVLLKPKVALESIVDILDE